MFLINKDIYDKVLMLDLSNKSIKEISRKKLNSDIVESGFYSHLSNKTIGLYRNNNSIYFFENKFTIQITSDITAEFEAFRRRRILKILSNNEIVYRIKYKVKNSIEDEDFTPFIDEEDFDFGLFIYNIINSTDRQKKFIVN